LIDIPPEIQLKSTIKSGSVYYFPEKTFQSQEPHYFIVINYDPIKDNVVLLVSASSNIERVKRRWKNFPDTVVEIKKGEYSDFTRDSIIDCNSVHEYSINQLIQKISGGKLKLKTEMHIAFVNKLRKAVMRSPTVVTRLKKLLTLSN
jgi:hypothetical protein